MSKSEKNLLMFGSDYPVSFLQDVSCAATRLGMPVIPTLIGSFHDDERFIVPYPTHDDVFPRNFQEIIDARVHVVPTAFLYGQTLNLKF